MDDQMATSSHAMGSTSARLPGVDVGALLAGARRWGRRRRECGGDPAPGVGRVDHVVELEVRRRVQSLAVLVGAGHHRRRRRASRSSSSSMASSSRRNPRRTAPSRPMPPTSPVGHATVKSGALKRAARHRLRPEPVALADDDREERHGQVRAGDEHAAHVAHQRGLLGLRPDHEARRVAQQQDRQVERVAQLHEARRLVGGVGVDRAAEVRRVVGDDADRRGPRRAPAP